MKNIVFLLIFFCSCVSAEEAPVWDKLIYTKFGITSPTHYVHPMLTVGFGARFQKERLGYDASLSIAQGAFAGYTAVKGLFLYYPRPENVYCWYFGAGPGVGYSSISFVPLLSTFVPMWYNVSFTLEGVIGCEYRGCCKYRPFVQLEVTQPVISLTRTKDRYPGIAIMAGVGF